MLQLFFWVNLWRHRILIYPEINGKGVSAKRQGVQKYLEILQQRQSDPKIHHLLFLFECYHPRFCEFPTLATLSLFPQPHTCTIDRLV